jgi:protein involved in temperature-dependent protein secretion
MQSRRHHVPTAVPPKAQCSMESPKTLEPEETEMTTPYERFLESKAVSAPERGFITKRKPSILLCDTCHDWVHSRQNAARAFLGRGHERQIHEAA